jgi:hypothetical protein
MKKLILFVMLCIPMALVAQNGVTVSNLAISSGTVTFDVGWKNTSMPTPWSDTVWVFVEYNDNGVMKRLPLSPGATLTATSMPGMGKVITVSGNNDGVWVVGNARTNSSFSATIQLLTTITNVTGACAYASNYLPVGKHTSATNISFTGTPQYNIVIKKNNDGTMETRMEDSPFTVPEGYTVQSFTDKTGAPGMLVPATYTLSGSNGCTGTNVMLTLSGSQLGWRYQLHRGAMAVGNVVDGTGNALTFSDAPGAVGNFNYTVWTVDNPAAEAQQAMQVSNVRAITVNPLPVATVAAKTICSGQTIVLTATLGSGTTTAMTYTWNIGGTTSTTSANSKTSQALMATTTYTVQLTNANGCVGVVSSPATITVNALPNVPTSPSSNARCGSGTVTFSATVPSGQTIDWYTTSTGTALVSGGSSVTSFSPNLATSTTYYAQARNTTTGCVSASRLAVGATINAVPAAPTSPSSNARCGSGTVTLSATVPSGQTKI